MATVVALDASPANLLSSMRGSIVDARIAYPSVLHVEVVTRAAISGVWPRKMLNGRHPTQLSYSGTLSMISPLMGRQESCVACFRMVQCSMRGLQPLKRRTIHPAGSW
jgi:hypothetical protein